MTPQSQVLEGEMLLSGESHFRGAEDQTMDGKAAGVVPGVSIVICGVAESINTAGQDTVHAQGRSSKLGSDCSYFIL